MGINNIDQQSLTFIFSIAQDTKTQEWGVLVEEHYILTGRKAVLHTVEKDAATGAKKASALAFKKRDLARYAYQMSNGEHQVLAAGFYYRALEKIGGKRDVSISELLKPFTATPR